MYDLTNSTVEIEADVPVDPEDPSAGTKKAMVSAPAGTVFGGWNGSARMFNKELGEFVRVSQEGVVYTDEAKAAFQEQMNVLLAPFAK